MASRQQRLAGLLNAAPIRPWLRAFPTWKGVLVLNYHRIGDSEHQPWDRTLWSVTEQQFDDQLSVLAREADVIGPGDLASVLAAGKGRHVMLTFDDGYRDNYELALPLLRSHGLTATFFLATGFIDDPRVAWWDEIAWIVRRASAEEIPAGNWLASAVSLGDDPDAAIAELVQIYKRIPDAERPAYLGFLAAATGSGPCAPAEAAGMWMTWDMARELRDAGMSIGGHTVTHPLLGQISPERQRAEIDECARRLREELSDPMRWFAYPVGSRDAFGATTKEILRSHDVEYAFSFYGGYLSGAARDRYDIPRVHVGPMMDIPRLRATLRMPQLFARSD
ncbi:MAG TPA: polysaccharide deacetylase family protein [Baekduia sp.]|nr:polysaccharide deacetylase family protein [Baekduia sp.]